MLNMLKVAQMAYIVINLVYSFLSCSILNQGNIKKNYFADMTYTLYVAAKF